MQKLVEAGIAGGNPSESERRQRRREIFTQLNAQACFRNLDRPIDDDLSGYADDAVGDGALGRRGNGPSLAEHSQRLVDHVRRQSFQGSRKHQRVRRERCASLANTQSEDEIPIVASPGTRVEVEIRGRHLTGLQGSEPETKRFGVAGIEGVDLEPGRAQELGPRELQRVQRDVDEVRHRRRSIGHVDEQRELLEAPHRARRGEGEIEERIAHHYAATRRTHNVDGAYRETLERSGDVEIDAVKAFLAAFEKVLRLALFPRKEAVRVVACPEHSIRAEADNRQSERGARARLGHDKGIVGRTENVVIT